MEWLHDQPSSKMVQSHSQQDALPAAKHPLSTYQVARMVVAFQQAGTERRWCQAVTTTQTGTALFVHLPCGCHIAVREVAPGAYAAAILPQRVGRHLGARFSERRIRAKNVYDATADAVGKGRANCIARARRELALHQEPASE